MRFVGACCCVHIEMIYIQWLYGRILYAEKFKMKISNLEIDLIGGLVTIVSVFENGP